MFCVDVGFQIGGGWRGAGAMVGGGLGVDGAENWVMVKRLLTASLLLSKQEKQVPILFHPAERLS